MSAAWFTEQQLDHTIINRASDAQEAAALKEYIRSTIVTAEAAALAITLPARNKPETVWRSHCIPSYYRLWCLFIAALTELPEHRLKIIYLLQAIQNLPNTEWKDHEKQTQTRWADLPDFGSMWFDAKVTKNWRSAVRSSPDIFELRRIFTMEATIEAQLVIAGVSGFRISCGLEFVCDALERMDAVPDFELPAVKEWLGIAGDRIYEGLKREMTGCLRERDVKIKSHEVRWNFWRSRLHSLALSETLDKETIEAAKKAIEEMDGTQLLYVQSTSE